MLVLVARLAGSASAALTFLAAALRAGLGSSISSAVWARSDSVAGVDVDALAAVRVFVAFSVVEGILLEVFTAVLLAAAAVVAGARLVVAAGLVVPAAVLLAAAALVAAVLRVAAVLLAAVLLAVILSVAALLLAVLAPADLTADVVLARLLVVAPLPAVLAVTTVRPVVLLVSAFAPVLLAVARPATAPVAYALAGLSVVDAVGAALADFPAAVFDLSVAILAVAVARVRRGVADEAAVPMTVTPSSLRLRWLGKARLTGISASAKAWPRSLATIDRRRDLLDQLLPHLNRDDLRREAADESGSALPVLILTNCRVHRQARPRKPLYER